MSNISLHFRKGEYVFAFCDVIFELVTFHLLIPTHIPEIQLLTDNFNVGPQLACFHFNLGCNKMMAVNESYKFDPATFTTAS